MKWDHVKNFDYKFKDDQKHKARRLASESVDWFLDYLNRESLSTWGSRFKMRWKTIGFFSALALRNEFPSMEWALDWKASRRKNSEVLISTSGSFQIKLSYSSDFHELGLHGTVIRTPVRSNTVFQFSRHDPFWEACHQLHLTLVELVDDKLVSQVEVLCNDLLEDLSSHSLDKWQGGILEKFDEE